MYLNSVMINNFRPFYGEHSFDFDKDFNLHVIVGRNGSGKSAILDSIYWCLYGREISNLSTQPLCNYTKIDEMSVGDKIHVSVSCDFVDNDTVINIHRRMSFVKSSEFNEVKSADSDIQFTFVSEDNIITSHENELIIKYFPVHLFPFLFFDNENNNFSLNNDYSNILKLFNQFAGQNILDKSIHHLEALSHDYNKKLKALNVHSADYSNMLVREQQLLKDVDEVENEISECKMTIHKLNEKYAELKSDLAQYPQFVEGTNVADLYNKIDQLSIKEEEINKDIVETQKKNGELAVKLYPILAAVSGMEDEFDISEFEDTLLKNTDFKNTRFYDGYLNIPELFNNVESVYFFKRGLENISILHREFLETHEEIENSKAIIDCIDDSYLQQLISKSDEIKRNIEVSKINLKRLKYRKASLNKDLNYLHRNLARYKEKNDIHSPIYQEYQFCLNAKEFGELVKKQLNENLLSEFSLIINDYFINQLNFSDKFKKIEVDDSFNIVIVKKSNQRIHIDDLSANERKLFIIALIFSIHECLQLEYLIILMDPFVNLDYKKKMNLMSFMSNNKSNQILLILNENQYSDDVKSNVNRYSLINLDMGDE